MKYVLVMWAMLQPGDIVLYGDADLVALTMRRAGPRIVEIRCDTPEDCVVQSYQYQRLGSDPADHLYCIDGKHVYEVKIPDMPVMSNKKGDLP